MRKRLRYFTKLEITLWSLSVMAILVSFIAFLVNDIYGYISWQRMKRQQAAQ